MSPRAGRKAGWHGSRRVQPGPSRSATRSTFSRTSSRRWLEYATVSPFERGETMADRPTDREGSSRRSHRRNAATFDEVVAKALTRRSLFKGATSAALIAYLPSVSQHRIGLPAGTIRAPTFSPIAGDSLDRIRVADGHWVDVVVRWGDPVLEEAPPFEPALQSPTAQAQQFGYNCDYVGFFPLPRRSVNSLRGLLVVNHEYTNPELMFPAYDASRATVWQIDVQLAAHGLSILDMRLGEDGRWRRMAGSGLNRRITGTTPIAITGPAAGHSLLRTAADPTGRSVLGTLGNCSAGKTPWGTVLSAEENFHLYFGNRDSLRERDPRRGYHARYGVPKAESKWGFERAHERFDIGVEPNEAFRFGWVVEVDPYDPEWVPRKRTALGRMRREAATATTASDGRLVLYSGDDIVFEYIYKFVTRHPWNPRDRRANRDLLDEGTLYVARFDHDGDGDWLPLEYGRPGLDESAGFESQADVLIHTLRAADAVGATRMDRPEDIEISPVDGHVFIALTKNALRGVPGNPPQDATNPRAKNHNGHIIELMEDGGDHAATTFTWRFFMLCGDPDDESTYFAGFDRKQVSAIACPDNLAFDRAGNLWIATDGQPSTLGINDALYAVPVSGPERGNVRRFFSAVPGAEVSGHEFTPDDSTLFLSVQHPGEGSHIGKPSSTWPDGTAPPRPSVVSIRAEDGGVVGSG